MEIEMIEHFKPKFPLTTLIVAKSEHEDLIAITYAHYQPTRAFSLVLAHSLCHYTLLVDWIAVLKPDILDIANNLEDDYAHLTDGLKQTTPAWKGAKRWLTLHFYNFTPWPEDNTLLICPDCAKLPNGEGNLCPKCLAQYNTTLDT
jgi:hypothetical protein